MRNITIFIITLFVFNFSIAQKQYILSKTDGSKIVMDGFISDDEKSVSYKKTVDYEWQPGYNTPAKLETDVFMSYTDEYMYFGVKAYTDPENIRGQVRPRDEMAMGLNEDIIFLRFDPYLDARSVYLLASNAYGSQSDIRAKQATSDEERYDSSFNAIYETISSINEDGYTIEFLIPFSSIPHPKGEDKTWGFNVTRYFTLDGNGVFTMSDKYDRDNPCRICQIEGRLIMNDVPFKRNTELLPYISSNLSGERVSDGQPIEYGKSKNEFGIGIKYDINSSSTAELTINPDFSQIEADETQIDINSAYALQYPELRPYFSRGMDLLNFLDNAFYSRTINSPSISSKITLQDENSSSIILSAVDQKSPYLVGGEDKSYFGEGGISYVNTYRHQRVVGQNTKYGFFTTNRFYEGGGSGNLFGIDGLFTFNKIWKIQFEFIKNFNVEPVANWIDSNDTFSDKTVKLDGEKFKGHANYIRLIRKNENWESIIFYRDISANYRADLGFVPKNNRRWLTISQGFEKLIGSKYLQQYRINVKGDITNNINGEKKSRNLDIDLGITTVGATAINYNYDINFFRNYLGKDFRNVGKSTFFIISNPTKEISILTRIVFGKEIAFNEDNPEIGKESSVFFSLNYKVGNNLNINPSLRFSKLKKINKPGVFYDGYIARLSSRYQFNNDLSLRIISEYDDFNDKFYIQPLLEWNPNPSTIFYIGGNQNSSNIFKVDSEDFNPFLINRSQFFIKFQYLFGI
ncbi:MAG: hypothetical protein O3A67_03920 [Bacteroidetes bacterium]|nr:hypothetical protein [Bacteroidota bacterium]